jgi:hypothetical protein
MSIIAFPSVEHPESCAKPCVTPAAAEIPAGRSEPSRLSGQPIRRRGSLEQGRALETLGHAVEYLIDSRLFDGADHNQRDEHEAVQILMRLSRAVFAECPQVISVGRRLRTWVQDRLSSHGGVESRGSVERVSRGNGDAPS